MTNQHQWPTCPECGHALKPEDEIDEDEIEDWEEVENQLE